ncbi:helix-turn-helix domain-containing protein [Streptomyces sp. CSDS2]|uniref:transcriptional regulator n=1 Tax=Streptomyces sp. CSDS2 TaxID=3055051 RepID=UPI0025AECF7D|nr:transcriptional regulator [Streptomyces sp. CSDS2]MDN3265002.1 helix-turn-helix domain-containing protein [Streptomyces sp. CSDS2]
MSEGIPESGFAELLRELKNRSGHSYGTLAKRLHMSTSTLHRYCNGDAVPTDYAPVERLARLCKATPGELVELHRRWVLADAGRGRKGAEPVVVPEAAPEPETAAQAAPEAEAAPEPGPVAAAVPGPEPVAAAVPGPEPVAAAVPGPESTPTTRWRRGRSLIAGGRRTALLAAVTVTALVVGGTVFALNRPSDEGERRNDAKAVTATVGSALVQDSATPRPSKSGSPSPSATRSASPSASASASAETRDLAPDTTDGKHTGKPSATARQEASGAVPLTVNTNPYSWLSPCSQHYLIDRPPAAVGPPPTEQQAPAWVAVNKAVSAGEQFITLTVQGTGSQTVVLERLSVRVAGKRAPLPWNDYAMGFPGAGCGGGVPTHSFTVSLDAMRPSPVPEAGSDNFPFKVSQSDPEVFYVTADASAYDVSWYLELTWSSGGRHGTLLIDDAGHPFRTSGNNSRPAYAFPLGGQKWKPASEFE